MRCSNLNKQFHIHVDALELSPEFKAELTSAWGFYESNFAGHPEGEEGFEPTHHLTRKTGVGREFRRIFESVRVAAAQPGALVGYIEGEYLPQWQSCVSETYQPGSSVNRRSTSSWMLTGPIRV